MTRPHLPASTDSRRDKLGHCRVDAEAPRIMPKGITVAHPRTVDLVIDERIYGIEIVVCPSADGVKPSHAGVSRARAEVHPAEIDSIRGSNHPVYVDVKENKVHGTGEWRFSIGRDARGC